MSGGEERAPVVVPSLRRRTRRNGRELAAMEIDMLNQLLGDLPETLNQVQSSPYVVRMKRLLLITLALWMSYFLVVHWFLHPPNKIALFGIPPRPRTEERP